MFDGVPYTVIFNIRDKGNEQYQYLIDFKENKTPGISNTAVNKPPASTPSVLQGQYTQSGTKSQQNSKTHAKMSHKLPVSRDVADREKLVDLFEPMVTNSSEYRVLENYRKHLDEMRQRIRKDVQRLDSLLLQY